MGALTLDREGDRLAARADIDHVNHRCRKGLINNIRSLRRLFGYVSRSCKVLGVGKTYDDDLYVYGVGRLPEAIEGFRLTLIQVEDMESLERFNRHLEPVPEEVLGRPFGGEP